MPVFFVLKNPKMMNEIEHLNKVFGHGGQIKISANPEGVAIVELNNNYAKVIVSIYGGQVLSFQPHLSNDDVLFLSEKAVFAPGKAIRGGCPICWPWFGDDTAGYGRPSHGFARNQEWQLRDTFIDNNDCISLTLGLTDTEGSLAVWPYPFELILTVTLGTELELSLTTRNIGKKSFTMTQALHTYFKISDIGQINISGLDGKNYLDKLDGFLEKNQKGNVVVNDEIDRVYRQVDNEVSLNDKGLDRRIGITAKGSSTTVVWNPWASAITEIADLENSDFRQFVCIETANAADDKKTLDKGEEHTITAIYSLR